MVPADDGRTVERPPSVLPDPVTENRQQKESLRRTPFWKYEAAGMRYGILEERT
jgi:hypothetical protein